MRVALATLFGLKSDSPSLSPFIYLLCASGLAVEVALNALFGFATDTFSPSELIPFVVLSLLLRTLRFTRDWVRLIMCCDAFLVLGILLHVALVVPWQVQAFALPLRDHEMRSLEIAIGFDFVAYIDFLNSHVWLAAVLDVAYRSFIPQVLLLGPLLIVCGRLRELERYFAGLAIALGIVCFVSVLVPTAGEIELLDPTLAGTPAWPRGATDLNAYFGLRDGSLRQLVGIPKLGIISFPSFHVACGVLVTFGLRSFPLLFRPVLVLNIVMAIATVNCGAHYIADVIGGVVSAFVAIDLAARGTFAGHKMLTALAPSAVSPGLTEQIDHKSRVGVWVRQK
jgi:membrane-associated phospholipid phosphatase